jgi:hypothetical protein
MSDLHDIALPEASGTKPNPPGLVSELRDIVADEFPETVGLTGVQVRELREAILSGFNRSELQALVQIQMNEHLETITSNGPLETVVLELINWAERQGRTEQFVRAVLRARPGNSVIQSVAASLPGIAKASEIRASTMQKLRGLDNERLKLISERDERDYKMFELKTERLRAATESLRVIKEMGIRLSERTTKRIEAALADLIDPLEP